jgi:hypothetical protein
VRDELQVKIAAAATDLGEIVLHDLGERRKDIASADRVAAGHLSSGVRERERGETQSDKDRRDMETE